MGNHRPKQSNPIVAGSPEGVELVSPYMGDLVDLTVSPFDCAQLFSYAGGLPSIQLSLREMCDLEMLACGAFSPLRGFMSSADYFSVLETMRLADGTVFPIPITLSVDDPKAFEVGEDIVLRSAKNDILAVMTLREVYEWQRDQFGEAVLGTCDPRHPLAAEMQTWGRFHLSGELRVLALPEYRDFEELRLIPALTRTRLKALGRRSVVAFQTRNPLHRAHEAMTKKAIEITGGTLLLHPVVGMTKEGDIDHYTRVRTYKAVKESVYAGNRVLLSLTPLAMRLAGPREAVWHAIIRRNYGADHFIVGRDHASPGVDTRGIPFYEPYAAQKLACEFGNEIGVRILPFREFAYLPDEKRFEEADGDVPTRKSYTVSGTHIRDEFLSKGKKPPSWVMRSEVAKILSESFPPKHRQGVCIWFTGLSASGKSTTAEIVTSLLLEEGRQVTLLDGDVVRTHLSKGLGFSREDRDVNVLRIGFVASEIVRHGGVAICAAVSPYRQSRGQVRQMFRDGHFVEVFVDAPLETCERRDPKGMYAKARRGEIKNFTGIDDIYEPPEAAEIVIDTERRTARQNASSIIEFIRTSGFLKHKKPRLAG